MITKTTTCNSHARKTSKHNPPQSKGKHPNDENAMKRIDDKKLRFHLSRSLLVASVSFTALIAFGLGTFSRLLYMHDRALLQQDHAATLEVVIPPVHEFGIPCTRYTSKVLSGIPGMQTFLVDQSKCLDDPDGEEGPNAQSEDHLQNEDDSDDDDSDDDDEGSEESDKVGLHLPTGFQLVVDAKVANKSILMSSHQLMTTIVELFKSYGFSSLLSYHCYSRAADEFLCLGLMPKAHFSLESFPGKGVLMMDFFTQGDSDLVPIYESIEKLLLSGHIPANGSTPEASVYWAQKLRGFREGISDDYNFMMNPMDGELTDDIYQPLNEYNTKKRIVTAVTDYQQVDIFEVVYAVDSYSLKSSPDKLVYLDGDVQSSLHGEVSYHEALVHPAMITHPNPKRVAIVGGGEGATLREVLKHKTVEEVVMVDIDEEFVNLCRVHLPEWSDCSDLVGSTSASCFDDERATVYFQDAFKYFIDRYGDGNAKEDELFDVVIMDACDPTDAFVEKLYKSSLFVRSYYNSLAEGGVFVAQIGKAPWGIDGGLDDTGIFKKAFKIAGFESMHIYDEAHSRFSHPWSYIIAFKDFSLRNRWYQGAAEIDRELQQRIDKTHSGKQALLYFDSSTMAEYQVPSKVYENVYCRLPLGKTLEECLHQIGYNQRKLGDEDLKVDAHSLTNPYSPVFERHSGELQAKRMNRTTLHEVMKAGPRLLK